LRAIERGEAFHLHDAGAHRFSAGAGFACEDAALQAVLVAQRRAAPAGRGFEIKFWHLGFSAPGIEVKKSGLRIHQSSARSGL
jgi:hypothetical protein